jgi:hypothetical protein
MRVRDIKRWIAPLRNTPLHPQWLLGEGLKARDLQKIDGVTTDIGCADQAIRHLLPESAQYIGLGRPGRVTRSGRQRPIPVSTAFFARRMYGNVNHGRPDHD